MNQALHPATMTLRPSTAELFADEARLKRLRALLALFTLYAAALLVVVTVSDGADVGCILAGIAGHVLFATNRVVSAWRDATWLDEARMRLVMRAAR
ncbi:MAG: hypothetical protein KF819_28300 [Labilithrix sp.]|nr:hypothetical protein [Labilithrix sp.]